MDSWGTGIGAGRSTTKATKTHEKYGPPAPGGCFRDPWCPSCWPLFRLRLRRRSSAVRTMSNSAPPGRTEVLYMVVDGPACESAPRRSSPRLLPRTQRSGDPGSRSPGVAERPLALAFKRVDDTYGKRLLRASPLIPNIASHETDRRAQIGRASCRARVGQ